MATQIKVNSATGNVTVQLSRTVIGTVVTANTANYANFAGVANTANNLNATTTANVVIGGGTNGYVLGTNGAGSLSWVEQTGGGGTYGDSNVVTLLDAFGSNTITTTGLITGNGGGLSNIAGANVSGVVANATHATISDSANSVAVANVAGIGNIATVNLDGNVANVLRGDGTFAADGVGTYGDSNVVTLLDAFGSNTITTSGNVSVGNLVADPSLLVNGVKGNVLIQPNVAFNSTPYSSITRGESDAVTGNSTVDQAFIIDNYTSAGITNFQTYANTAAGQLAKGASFNLNSVAAIGNANTDPLVTNAITFNTNPSLSNLADASGATATSMQMGGGGAGGFVTVVGSGAGDTDLSGAWKQFQYRPKAMDFIRRNGNGEARTGVVANDETSLNFYGTQNFGGNPATTYNFPAKVGMKVDPTWVDPNNGAAGVPEGVFFQVVDTNFDRIDHRMYANGTVIFNESAKDYLNAPVSTNPVTIGADGVITGDGGGLSNVSTGPLGNLSSLTINDSVANSTTHQIDPTLITMPVNYTDTKAQEVITLFGDDVTPNYYGGNTTTTFLMNDINAGTAGFSPVVTDYAASNGAGGYSQSVRVETGMDFVGVAPSGTNAYAPGKVQYTFAGPDSDLTSDATLGEVKFSQGGIAISPRTTTATQAGIINVFHYGTNISDPTDANGLDFTRRRGNNASRVSIAAGDYLGNIRWAGKKSSGFQSTKARIGGRISPSWDGTQQPPAELFMNTQDQVGTTSTWEYGSDGDSFMPGNLTLNGSGIFTGDGGGLSNIAGVSPGGFTDSVQFKNSGGTFDGDSVFTYNQSNKRLALNGTGGAGLPATDRSQLLISNGGLQVIQTDVDGGVASMGFTSYFSTSFIAPYTFYRGRGTQGSPLAVQGGDAIKNESYIVYADSGNTFYGAGTNSVTVTANDGAGNVQVSTSIQSGPGTGQLNRTNGSQINLDTNFTKVTNDLIVGNDNTNGGNIELNRALDGASAGLNPQGFIKKYNRVYGEFFDGGDITATTINTPEVLAIGATLSNNNIFNTAGTYTVNVGGKYSVSLNAHLLNDSSGVNADAYFWIRQNGSDVSDTMRKINTQNNYDTNLDLEFLVSLNDFDTVQIMWAVENLALKCKAIAANSAGFTHPRAPSATLAITPVGA